MLLTYGWNVSKIEPFYGYNCTCTWDVDFSAHFPSGSWFFMWNRLISRTVLHGNASSAVSLVCHNDNRNRKIKMQTGFWQISLPSFHFLTLSNLFGMAVQSSLYSLRSSMHLQFGLWQLRFHWKYSYRGLKAWCRCIIDLHNKTIVFWTSSHCLCVIVVTIHKLPIKKYWSFHLIEVSVL